MTAAESSLPKRVFFLQNNWIIAFIRAETFNKLDWGKNHQLEKVRERNLETGAAHSPLDVVLNWILNGPRLEKCVTKNQFQLLFSTSYLITEREEEVSVALDIP